MAIKIPTRDCLTAVSASGRVTSIPLSLHKGRGDDEENQHDKNNIEHRRHVDRRILFHCLACLRRIFLSLRRQPLSSLIGQFQFIFQLLNRPFGLALQAGGKKQSR